MANQIRMTPETMRQRAREVDGYTRTVQELRGKAEALLNTLKAEWEGEAVRGYEDRYNKIKPVFQNAQELFDEISKNLTKTAQIVEETDRNIASQFRK